MTLSMLAMAAVLALSVLIAIRPPFRRRRSALHHLRPRHNRHFGPRCRCDRYFLRRLAWRPNLSSTICRRRMPMVAPCPALPPRLPANSAAIPQSTVIPWSPTYDNRRLALRHQHIGSRRKAVNRIHSRSVAHARADRSARLILHRDCNSRDWRACGIHDRSHDIGTQPRCRVAKKQSARAQRDQFFHRRNWHKYFAFTSSAAGYFPNNTGHMPSRPDLCFRTRVRSPMQGHDAWRHSRAVFRVPLVSAKGQVRRISPEPRPRVRPDGW